MTSILNGIAYNATNSSSLYIKWTNVGLPKSWIDKTKYDTDIAAKDKEIVDQKTEYESRIAAKDAEIEQVKKEAEEAIARANVDVQYSSGTIYNWDGNVESWYRWDTYAMDCNYTQEPWGYSQPLRFDNWTKYVFWGFPGICWPTKGSYTGYQYVSPFEYFVIDKETSKITRNRWGVSTISTRAPNTNAGRWMQTCTPNRGWREYKTEYRNYYYQNNYSKNYAERNGNIAGYFYIKKDLSAMWYVAASDVSGRDTYGNINTDYDTEWSSSRTMESLFSNYTTDFVGNYDSSNVLYAGKLYTAQWYQLNQNSWNSGYGYCVMYTVRKP